MTKQKQKSNVLPLGTFVAVAIAILLAAIGAYGILVGLPDWLHASSQTLAVLLVAGLIAVTLLLYFGTIIMRAAGLESKKEALGMPEGSIRALIAMSLILMFAIIGVTVLYSGMGGDPIQSNGVTAEQMGQLENVQIISISVVDPAASPGTERFNVTARPELSQFGHDFGLQLLTTVSTLVVAVAGFYFGSRAVAQGAKNAAEARDAALAASRAATDVPTAVAVGPTVAVIDDEDLVGAVEEVSAEEPGTTGIAVDADLGDAEPSATDTAADDTAPADTVPADTAATDADLTPEVTETPPETPPEKPPKA